MNKDTRNSNPEKPIKDEAKSLTDSLVGILKHDYDLEEIRKKKSKKYDIES